MPISAPAPRLAIVASHPIQHFCPLYRALSADGRLDLKVFFASDSGKTPYFDPAFGRHVDWGSDITDGFEHEYLPGFDSYDLTEQRGSKKLGERLAIFGPDVVQFYGYGSKLARQTLFWAKRNRRHALMVGDSELLSPRSARTRAFKGATLPILLRLPDGYLTIGDENERYYTHYGVARHRMARSPIPIDSALLDMAIRDRERICANVRTKWLVNDDDVVHLIVGKTVPRKSHQHVLQAIAELPMMERDRAVAVFAGGGPGTGALKHLAGELNVRTVMPGFLRVPDLADAYVAADVLVHPSAADPHPLAIAEAVYAGLPVVLSDRVGSWGASDDVRAANGLRYPYGNIAKLSKHLANVVRDGALRQKLGEESRMIGQTRALDTSVSSYVDAVLRTIRGHRIAPTFG